MITIHWLSIVMFYLVGAFISCVLGIVILTTSTMLNGSPYFIRHKKQTFIDFIITCLCSWYGVFAIIVWFLGELESYFRKRKRWYAVSVIQYLQKPTLTPKRTILKIIFKYGIIKKDIIRLQIKEWQNILAISMNVKPMVWSGSTGKIY